MRTLYRSFAFLFLVYWLGIAPAQAQDLQSPEAFLGYELGTEFTLHHRVLDYVEHVAENSPHVELREYGESYEGRPLLIAKIASTEHHNRLDQIRQENLQRAGLSDGAPPEGNPAIVWLSYGVHGNESVSTESAMQTLYELADPTNSQSQQWLEDAIVIMDPLLNPDGRERYVNWYKQTAGAAFNPRPEAREHQEPWPGGRTNHYYFDLNRDWAWASQQETQQRLNIYNEWMPHVHVDFHEMGVDSPYYFAPAAEPFHEAITDWQREFQTTIGENHARYFDQEGRLYFTREIFDLFYPGYGDTWPTYNGAIGMTYEQGGSGRAGLGIITAEGDTLTLRDRMENHHVTGMSTVEVTAQHADRVVEEFARFHEANQAGEASDFGTFVIKEGDNRDQLDALAEHLDRQGIEYGYATGEQNISGFSYRGVEESDGMLEDGDMIVPTAQAKGTLADVLLEPQTTIIDSLTYDITAWSLPYAYGLDAFALTESIAPQATSRSPRAPREPALDEPYAYIAEWNSTADLQYLSRLLTEDIRPRVAQEPFSIGDQSYDRGTLIITRARNEHLGANFDQIVRDIAQEYERHLDAAATGFVDQGPDFGSRQVAMLDAPDVLLLAGEPASSSAVGEIWHFFDQQINYPVTLIYPDDYDISLLREYDVFILPDGFYGDFFSDEQLDEITEWVQQGGRLISMGAANDMLADTDGFSIGDEVEADDVADNGEQQDPSDLLRTYADRQREAATQAVPGSIFRARLDNTHPLGFGYDNTYFTLKRGDRAYSFLENGWNVIALQEDAHVSGFTGSEALDQLENTLVYGVEDIGQGHAIYMIDNPLFRGFWENGKLIFGNAVFFVGQ